MRGSLRALAAAQTLRDLLKLQFCMHRSVGLQADILSQRSSRLNLPSRVPRGTHALIRTHPEKALCRLLPCSPQQHRGFCDPPPRSPSTFKSSPPS